MSTTVLSVSDKGYRFLGKNTSVSSRLGNSSERSLDFMDADAIDLDDHQIDRFRGLDSHSPFYLNSTQSFRGLHDPPTFSRSSFQNSSFLQVSLSSTETIEELLDGRKIRVNDRSENSRAISREASKDPYDAVYTSEDRNVHDVLAESDELTNAYVEGRTHNDLPHEDKLADLAEVIVGNGISADRWRQYPDLARLAVENRADFQDQLEESSELSDLMNAQPEDELLQRSREQVVEAVSEKLQNSSEILDEEFLNEYPLLALYLLRNPGLIEYIEQNTEFAEQYRADAGRITESMRDDLPELADEAVDSSPFDEDYFAANPDMAEVVLNDAAADSSHPFATWLEQQEIQRKEASPSTLAESYWLDRAREATRGESNIPDFLFSDNPPLSMMASLNQSLADTLTNNSELLYTLFGDTSEDSLFRRAQRAYGLGLSQRINGEYQRIA
ncbi:hypothetical protein K8I28_00775 [bacterium]|nr:hypothetical protein [bacterium]